MDQFTGGLNTSNIKLGRQIDRYNTIPCALSTISVRILIAKLDVFVVSAGLRIYESVIAISKIKFSNAVFHLNCSTSILECLHEYVTSLAFLCDPRGGHLW